MYLYYIVNISKKMYNYSKTFMNKGRKANE